MWQSPGASHQDPAGWRGSQPSLNSSGERRVNKVYWKDPTEITREEITEKVIEIYISQQDQFMFPPIYQKVPGSL